MQEDREYITFYKSWIVEMLENEPDREKVKDAVLAIVLYGFFGHEVEIKNGAARAVYGLAKKTLDVNDFKRETGKKGGRPKKEK